MKSMTGFGRAEGTIAGGTLTVELRSVNHRYLDVRLRAPGWLSALERTVGDRIRKKFSRGAIEGSLRFRADTASGGQESTKFQVDEIAMASFLEAVQWLEKKGHLAPSSRPTLSDLLGTGRIVVAVENPLDATQHQDSVLKIVDDAISDLDRARATEGKKVAEMLRGHLGRLLAEQAKIAPLKTMQSSQVRDKLLQRIANWGIQAPVDAHRLEWEVAFHADRSDFTEESERLAAHCVGFDKMLGSKEPVGRKLDFLLQEMSRETNTMSAKTVSLDITNACIEMKSAIEQLREQVQNVE